ncbi:sulfatase [Sunxiuqinia elliptica]
MKYNRILLLPILVLLLSCNQDAKKNQTKKRPNILFILVDDMGYHDLNFTGSTYYETPNIDKLAKEGTVFTQGYATSCVCSPSRASILTGKFTARHGVTDWIGAASGENWRKRNRYDKLLPADYLHALPEQDTTLAEAFKKAGYTTFFAGKWHLGGKGSLPLDHGFQINKGGWDKGSPIGGYFSPWRNPSLENKLEGENLTMRLAQETANFIEENKDSAFLAYLSFYAVHGPIETTFTKWQKYRDKAEKSGLAENGFAMEKVLPIRLNQDNPVYAGLVESVDDAVGVLLKKLEELHLDENTIIVFTSDNGGVASGDSYSTSNRPLRGGKGYQWEGGIREPYIIKAPGYSLRGGLVDIPVTGADFYPTLLDLAGLELLPNQHVDGISLKPFLAGDLTYMDRPLFWHYPHYGNQGGKPSSIIRKGNWKLIHYWEDERNELYNLNQDPEEQSNVAEINLEIAMQMEEELLDWLNSVGAKRATPDPEYNSLQRGQYEANIKKELLPNLEKHRKEMLSKDFEPNRDWWGSKVTKD